MQQNVAANGQRSFSCELVSKDVELNEYVMHGISLMPFDADATILFWILPPCLARSVHSWFDVWQNRHNVIGNRHVFAYVVGTNSVCPVNVECANMSHGPHKF